MSRIYLPPLVTSVSISSNKRKFCTRPKAIAVVIHWTMANGRNAKGNRKMLNKVITVKALEAVIVTPVRVAWNKWNKWNKSTKK